MLTELRRALPTVRALPGSAEAISLPDASVDAVLTGNAMHSFDLDVAGPEIARVLEPDGILAGLWNVFDDRVDWVARLERISGSAAIGPRDTFSSWRAETAAAASPNGGSIAQFGSPEQAEFSHGQRRTADSLVATFATKAGMLVMPEQGTRGHPRSDPRFPHEQTGDRSCRIHPADADLVFRRATVKTIDRLSTS